MKDITISELYQIMHATAGPSGWWPANSKEEILLGAILVQNTNWQNAARSLANIKAVTEFHPKKLAALSREQLKELIRPSGFYENKSRAIDEFLAKLAAWEFDYDAIRKVSGTGLRDELLAFHGIGPETADVLRLYVFDQVAFVADSYARRLFTQLGCEDFPTYASLAKGEPSRLFLRPPKTFTGKSMNLASGIYKEKQRFEQSFLSRITVYFSKKTDPANFQRNLGFFVLFMFFVG